MTAAGLAQAATALGLPCFACNGDKQPIVGGGFKAATTDPAALGLMFSSYAARMIGVPTGRASGLVVVDVDVKGGARGREWLARNRGRIPATRAHATGSGGLRLAFKVPAGPELRNSASRMAPGVDVRGEGGYVIAPPSPGYSVADESEPAEMPAWLVEACRAPEPPAPTAHRPISAPEGDGSAYGLAALDDECDAIVRAPFGQQETTLNSACLKIGALASGGELAAAFALSRLLAAGRAMPSQPGERAWSPREVENKVRRAFADGQGSPRAAPPREEPPRKANGAHEQAGDDPACDTDGATGRRPAPVAPAYAARGGPAPDAAEWP